MASSSSTTQCNSLTTSYKHCQSLKEKYAHPQPQSPFFYTLSFNAIHMEAGLVAVPLYNSPTIVTLKGITPTMETIKHKERKHQRMQQCLRVKQPFVSLSPPFLSVLSLSFLPLLSLSNQGKLPAHFPSTGPQTGDRG